MAQQNILRLVGVSGGYHKERKIINDLDLEICSAQSTSVVIDQEAYSVEKAGIIGDNGAGKSTISKLIMGLLPFSEGDVLLNGININRYKTYERTQLGLGYFYQGGRIFPNLSVEENLKLASINNKSNQYVELFKEFELFNNEKRRRIKAGFLSGGEKNQLALAMVISSVKELKFLIADEPSAGLSPSNTNVMYELLNVLVRKYNCGLLLIEQNLKFAKENSDTLYKLTNQKLIRVCTEKENSPKYSSLL